MESHERVELRQFEGLAAPVLNATEEELDWRENQHRTREEQHRTDRVFWGLCSIGTLMCATLLLIAIGVRARSVKNSGAWQTASAERDKMTPANPSAVTNAGKPNKSTLPPDKGSETTPDLRRIATAADR